MSAFDSNPLARRAIELLRKSKIDDIFPISWEYVHRATKGRFSKMSTLVTAKPEALLPLTPEDRDAILRVIVQALEAGDISLLSPDPHFIPEGKARPTVYR